MTTKATELPNVDERTERRPPVREEMRPARGLMVGLTLSTIVWLGLLVAFLAS